MNKVSIIVYEKSLSFIEYLAFNSIYYDKLKKYDDVYYLEVEYLEYKKISRIYKTKIIKYYGKKGMMNYFKYHKYMLISFLIFLFVLKLLTMTIFDIRVYSDDENIKNKILASLNNNGISKNRRKKSFEEISNIKKNILNDNKDILEWIEINEKGCIYEVFITPRVIDNKNKKNTDNSSIYASNDGVIKHIVVSSGTKMADIGDFVKKGDLLISGNIYKNDEIVLKTHSEGIIYAEVWYLAYVSVPFDYIEVINTNRVVHHYYLDVFNHKLTIMGKYDSHNIKSTTRLLIDKPLIFFIIDISCSIVLFE